MSFERIDKHFQLNHNKQQKISYKEYQKIYVQPLTVKKNLKMEEKESEPMLSLSEALPSKPSKRGVSILKNAKKLTSLQLKQFKIKNASFRFCYSTSTELLGDFKIYQINQLMMEPKSAADVVANVFEIWKKVDPLTSISNNQLRHKDAIQDYYFQPLYKELVRQSKVSIELQTSHEKSTTIQNKLNSLIKLMYFLITRDIYAGIII